MSKKTDRLHQSILLNLRAHGLDNESAITYIFLLENGEKSALSISRSLAIPRTRVYRILDSLYEKKLVVRTMTSAGFRFLAAHPKQLNTNLQEAAVSLKHLQTQTVPLIEQLMQIAGQFQASSEVKYYNGLDGLKQVTYNSLAAKKNLYIFELDQDMSKFIDYEFSEEIRKELVANEITTNQLTNLKRILPYTEVTEMVEKLWRIKHIDPAEFAIRFEVLIYNDVYAMYTYERGEAFCVEIHNRNLADMQKQLFKFVWQKAQTMKIYDPRGGARL